jgi:hypothetical protein
MLQTNRLGVGNLQIGQCDAANARPLEVTMRGWHFFARLALGSRDFVLSPNRKCTWFVAQEIQAISLA